MCHRILPLLFLLACTGCGGVFSVHPLSDDSNSVTDERLFGQWQGERQDDRRCTLTIRKLAGARATLEIISECSGDEPGSGDVDRTTAFALRDEYDLLSVRVDDKDQQKPAVYAICRYRLRDLDRVELSLLDEETLARAVERGDLLGDVSYVPEARPPELEGEETEQPLARREAAERQIRGVDLSDTPERILEFIRRTGEDAFSQERVVLLRRVPSADSARDSASGVITATVIVMLVVAVLAITVFVRRSRRHPVAR